MGIFKLRFPEKTDTLSILEQIARIPLISKAEPNYIYPISLPYIYSEMSANSEPFITPGSINAVPIAILDTGLALDAGLQDLILATLDVLNPNDQISDSLGHGTQMALIASGAVKPLGVSGDSKSYRPVIAIRAFDDSGLISSYDLMKSVDFAIHSGARVMSLSWGSEIRSGFVEKTLDYAKSKKLIIVASAGNEPTGKKMYPAAYESVIGVGALAPNGKPWKMSNYGDFVTLYAPGFAALPGGNNEGPGTYAGTSISAAFMANVIANYLVDHPEASTQEVIKAFQSRP
ncbi:MAG: S8/S53 family peptidase [Desulfobacterales bacterium]|nr:S8/S53 family peptidase [Desulfobacterales bacterium]